MELSRRQAIFGLGACAVAASAWYLSKKPCNCGDCFATAPCNVRVIDCAFSWLQCRKNVTSRIEVSRVVAFDCVWIEDSFRNHKVALLQIAVKSDLLLLVRLSVMGTVLEELAAILKDPTIIKVGYDILNKAKKFQKDYNVQINGCLDLRYMALTTPAIRQKFVQHRTDLSFEGMAAAILGQHIGVRPELRFSNWESNDLSDEQLAFACTHVSLTYYLLVEIILSSGVCARVISWFLPDSLWLDHFILTDFNEYIGLPFRRALDRSRRKEKPDLPGNHVPEKALKSYTARKTPLYDNSILLCPDGELLCTCDKRKARWYVDNNLGKLITSSPFTVQLSFEPASRTILDGAYYTLAKDEVCVICGMDEDLIRKYVIPKEYRRHFPKIMKHHCAHDIVLACIQCHYLSSAKDDKLRAKLVRECDASRGKSSEKLVTNRTLKSICYAAKALQKFSRPNRKGHLPPGRRLELETLLRKHLNVTTLTPELIEETTRINFRERNDNYVSHGETVVKQYAERGELLQFETMWRRHFLESMNPGFLPQLWSENHHHEVLAVKLAFLRDASPKEAAPLISMLGFTEDQVSEIFEKVVKKEKIRVEKMSLHKGRLMGSDDCK